MQIRKRQIRHAPTDAGITRFQHPRPFARRFEERRQRSLGRGCHRRVRRGAIGSALQAFDDCDQPVDFLARDEAVTVAIDAGEPRGLTDLGGTQAAVVVAVEGLEALRKAT